jgi:hypothetical protein
MTLAASTTIFGSRHNHNLLRHQGKTKSKLIISLPLRKKHMATMGPTCLPAAAMA